MTHYHHHHSLSFQKTKSIQGDREVINHYLESSLFTFKEGIHHEAI